MQLNQLIAAVRGVVRDREIARLMPAASHKAEPKAPSPAQRLLAQRQAARKEAA